MRGAPLRRVLPLDNCRIHRTIGRCTPKTKKNCIMNIVCIMSDKDTGEILWQTSRQLSCNFVKGDAGRLLISNMIDSAIKGVRISEHKFINCSIDFKEPEVKKEMELPFM